MVKAESVTTVELEIDGRKVTADRDETILQVARRHGIYIPTMCYLTKVKPIASCRMCVVNVEGLDDPVLSCQERVVEGLKVTTDSEDLYLYRQNIMKLYDVNHPLECGVCPKSGECDLQNKTLEFNVNGQDFSAREKYRPLEKWGNISYDPHLCILCERCVRVSNEIVGDEALQIEPGGYNSKIVNLKQDDTNVDWGECAAVCPVGALADTHFKSSTNPWELEKIPAACAHSSFAHFIYYEMKFSGSEDREKIYRVRNVAEYDTISGVCRYGYDFENRGSNSDADMQKAVAAFEKADAIRFNSMITNEEALILQRLKEARGYKLFNEDARNYQKFLQAFTSVTGGSLYGGEVGEVDKSDYIVVVGTRVAEDEPAMKFKINQASKRHRAEVIYLHPMEDESIRTIVTQFVKYEAGSEESVLALLAKAFLAGREVPADVKAFLESLDEGYISAESNVGEEEIAGMLRKAKRKKHFTIVAGADLYAHPEAENIARILGLLEKYADFDVIAMPTMVNTLGVSLICDLDAPGDVSYVIGYNEPGDFVLSALENRGDVNMPALNQQEGTFTTIAKTVVPTHVALGFEGFCLNDIANRLGLNKAYTIDYTAELPEESGFQRVAFDDLTAGYDHEGNEVRGYALKERARDMDAVPSEPAELESYDGTVVYICNPNAQKNVFTDICENLPRETRLRGSVQFATAAKIADGDRVAVELGGETIERTFMIDENLKGTIALMPIFDLGFEGQRFGYAYRFNKAKIKQVSQ